MRKFLLTFCLMFTMLFGTSIESSAQTYTYRSFQFSYKQQLDNGRWTDWSKWEDSNLVITIDYDNDVIKIYSQMPQKYVIVSHSDSYTDESGGRQVRFNFIDQDGDKGTIRFRIEKNGNSQLYIDFADIMWVYNVRKIE